MPRASSVATLMESIGTGAVTATVSEIKNADVAIIIGARPTQNHPVAFTFIKNEIKKGLKLIIMDLESKTYPKIAETSKFKPGTDVALLNGMLNVIIEEVWLIVNNILRNTEGTENSKHVKVSSEEMSMVCGISAKEIRETARTFAKAKAAMIFWGMGISQHIHGTDNSRCLISLGLTTGNVGRPGTGLHPLEDKIMFEASDVGLIPMVSDCQPISDPKNVKNFRELLENGVRS